MDRSKTVIRTSVIGILANVFLSAFKLIVGTLSHSIAIMLDAVNNLSDALSSVVTIIGTCLAGRKPDKKHPFGHGRAEYLSASVIAVIILYAGVTALIESVKKIISPVQPDYSAVTLVIVGAAVAVKFLLGRYFIKTGKRINSDSLVASGKDAALDSAVSLSTLAAAVVFVLTNGKVSVEAYLGALISVLMIRSGIEMLRETISHILGERPETEKAAAVKTAVLGFSEVYGVYDLILHSYGPDYVIGSLHIEVNDDMSVAELDRLERNIADKVYEESGVILGGISVYGKNTRGGTAEQMQLAIRRRVMAHEHVLQMHGFYIDEQTKQARFDIVVGFDAPDRAQVCREVTKEITSLYPDYTFRINLDSDFA
ncbi:MAG: cation transporter [Clostridia bacterium]|nr:cation transporter [Clostridia bacterium]